MCFVVEVDGGVLRSVCGFVLELMDCFPEDVWIVFVAPISRNFFFPEIGFVRVDLFGDVCVERVEVWIVR